MWLDGSLDLALKAMLRTSGKGQFHTVGGYVAYLAMTVLGDKYCNNAAKWHLTLFVSFVQLLARKVVH
jgi:hypothetical protein